MNQLIELPDNARVWLYAANRLLTKAEQEQIMNEAAAFITGWTSHEHKMDAAFDILHNVFLVLALNEDAHAASGCGIDKSVAFFKKLEQTFGLQLFNRLQIELITPKGLFITDKSGVADMLASGQITTQTISFNKQITLLKELRNSFEIPLHKAWFYPALAAGNPAA